MKKLLILILSVTSALMLNAADKRPNIIFLFADDQTFDSLGCYGNKDVKTKHIDALSAKGLTFDHYYNTTAICMASRANVMTGMYEYANGCNFDHGDLPQKHFDTSYPMLLRNAGYLTAIAGKIGFEVEGVGLPKDSFDWWGASPGQTQYETKKNKSIAKYAEEYPHSTLAYGAFGSDFIEWATNEEKPFCLSISFKAPHQPVQPDPRFNDIYANTTFTKPANYGREHGEHFSAQSKTGRQYTRFESWGYKDNFNETMRLYHQQIYAIDQALGMLTKKLKQAGVSDNTVIIYTSDNGFFNGAHGYGSKVLPYEESARAPMIIHDPRKPESHGKRTSSLTGNIDVAPTIMELASVTLPEKMDGKSLLPLLSDQETKLHDELALMNCWGPKSCKSFGVLTDRYKYIYWYYEDDNMKPAEELYDLKNDRSELNNIATENPEVLQAMHKIYDQQIANIKAKAERPKYQAYATIFSRTAPWEDKEKLLGKNKKAKNKKKK